MTATAPTLERLFESPGLTGPVPGMARYAPDGRRIAFLRPADDDFERLDLWLHDLETNRARCLVDARSLGEERELSAVEKARRERLRVFAAGIVEFQWNQDGSALLFPLAGRLYHLDPDDVDARPEPLTPEERFVTDVRVAAFGAIGFVHEQNLWLLQPGAAPRALTRDGGGSVSYGLPDFIAAEEMHRFDGYWFSPAGDRIAVLRVDEAPIPSSLRQEIDGDGFSLHEQRYPYAGGPNARVELGIIDLPDGEFAPLDWTADDSEYLARVNWLPDGSGLLVQRQTRDQKRLDLVRLPLDGRPGQVVLREHSDTWINLNDDLQILADGRTALWSSERDDVCRLHRLDLETGDLEPLTPADGMVHRLVAVDERSGQVFVEGTFEHPTRRQLYRVELTGGAPVRLTDGAGCHGIRMAPDHASFLDRHESLDRPPALALRDAEGGLLAELVPNDPGRSDHPLHPFLAGRVRPELGELEAEDGQRLCWRLTRPLESAPGQRHPVIVSVYGGPGVQRVQDAFGPLMHQYFASRGWGVLELDNRGASGRGRRFEAAIHGHMGAAEVADQMRGVDMLRQLDWVDPDRIGVFGHSYGGYMALMCLARHPDRFRAAVSVAPVTDWRLYDTHYTERYLGHPEQDPGAYEDSSVLGRVDGLAAADPGALLLMHGMADDNVLFTHSTRLMKALQDRGVRFEFMAYPAAKHGLAGAATGLHRFRVIEAFLARRFGEEV